MYPNLVYYREDDMEKTDYEMVLDTRYALNYKIFEYNEKKDKWRKHCELITSICDPTTLNNQRISDFSEYEGKNDFSEI